MKKKFTKIGNSWAMLFTKTILELLEINPEQDEIELTIENKTLKIEKVKKA